MIHRQAPAAEGGRGQLVAQRQTLLGGNGAHVVQLVEQGVGELQTRRIPGVQLLQDAHEFGHHAAQLVVLLVVVAVLQVVPADHLDLAVVVLVLPLQEVDLLQELSLVELELPHRAGVAGTRRMGGVLLGSGGECRPVAT